MSVCVLRRSAVSFLLCHTSMPLTPYGVALMRMPPKWIDPPVPACRRAALVPCLLWENRSAASRPGSWSLWRGRQCGSTESVLPQAPPRWGVRLVISRGFKTGAVGITSKWGSVKSCIHCLTLARTSLPFFCTFKVGSRPRQE